MNKGNVIFGFIVIMFTIIIGATIGGTIYYDHKCEKNPEYDSVEIASLERNSKIEGSGFILGTSINEKPTYYFYEVNEDGSYILGDAPASSTKIVEGSDNPRHNKCKDILYVPEDTIKREFEV